MDLDAAFRKWAWRAHLLTDGPIWNVGLKGAWALAVTCTLALALYVRSKFVRS